MKGGGLLENISDLQKKIAKMINERVTNNYKKSILNSNFNIKITVNNIYKTSRFLEKISALLKNKHIYNYELSFNDCSKKGFSTVSVKVKGL